MNIHYFNEDVNFQITKEKHLTDWILDIIHSYQFDLEILNYIFCSDQYLLELNKEHLNHDYYTDIITFDNSDETNKIESDIFISIDRVKENAKKQSVALNDELYRVMIHGVLHLIGFNDKTPKEKALMREKENACLSLLKI
ncbi:rRNA maturation RNase YbeY [Ekhidna sp.]|uniref:rRNA maturation RNase YbeY n=1 Tax=Ekhidna sp. TaxID=2608089 RepID=UPI003299AFE7